VRIVHRLNAPVVVITTALPARSGPGW
jgi:hypothetical protein